MLESLITSRTRIRLLLKFFSNNKTRSYLRGLAEEFGESTNSVRVELNRLKKTGLLHSKNVGRIKMYEANVDHPLYQEVRSLVIKYLGIDQIAEKVVSRLGNVQHAFVTGDYAQGKDTGLIDLVIIGDIDWEYLIRLIGKAEDIIDRKIRPLILNEEEFAKTFASLDIDNAIVLWNSDDPDNSLLSQKPYFRKEKTES